MTATATAEDQRMIDQTRAIAEDLGAKSDLWADDDPDIARWFCEASEALHAVADRLEERAEQEHD
jgi:hypothetical protein